MSSTRPATVATAPSTDDRTTKARIRDAAIACFADAGVSATTVRRIAETAGVSPGLVIHHYGSMENLRTACDHHVAATIRRAKHDALSTGPQIDILAALRGADSFTPMLKYLAEVVTEDSPAVASLVDDLVADAEEYLRNGIESGMLRPTDDLRGRAVVLTMWNLGALALHRHLGRLLDIDLTTLRSDADFVAYAGPIFDIYARGILTDEFAEHVRRTIGDATTSHDESRDPISEEQR